MGFFLNKFIQQGIFSEAAPEEEPTDYTANDNEEQQYAPQDNDQPEDQNPPDEGGQPEAGGNAGEEPTDYTDNGYDEDGGDAPQESEPSGDEEEQPVDDIKAKEEELYAALSTEQLDIKHKELKNNFLTLFDNLCAMEERIGDINISEDNISTIEYISKNISALKDMVADYMGGVYKTKSYTENSIVYNRFLATLNGLDKILQEIVKKEE